MSWLVGATLLFLGVSLVLYVLFAGADFGAGILELFLGRVRRAEQRQLISHAMAPVWEANHVWLVLAIVIVFMGFPPLYQKLCVSLHLPMIAVLVGIVLRGSAFTFRYYDTVTPDFHKFYSWVFVVSSLWTPFFLGVTAAAFVHGPPQATAATYYAFYVAPWASLFCAAVGVLACCAFAFLAAVYLVGEAEDAVMRNLFRKRAAWANAAMVLVGGIVFLAAWWEGVPLLEAFVSQPLTLACFALASGLLVPFWWALLRMPERTWWVRTLGAALVTWVMAGWFSTQAPYSLFVSAAAPEATLRVLLGALVFGSVCIFPALLFLFRVFKTA